LGVRGRLLVEQGEIGDVVKVLRNSAHGVYYQVQFHARIFQVPEAALDLSDDQDADATGLI
jgi:nitrogen fixation protein NifZ